VKTNNQESGGPVARTLIRFVAPIFMKTFLTPEKMFGPVHRYRIDWGQRVTTNAGWRFAPYVAYRRIDWCGPAARDPMTGGRT
jgi:hypothetical protein